MMTYKELYDDVCHLGFESDVESAEAFLFAANRSQHQLFVDVREVAACTVAQGTTVADLSVMIPDLLFFLDVRRADGTVVGDAVVHGHILTVPAGIDGELTVYYHRAPVRLRGDDAQTVDVPQGCEHLLSLLTASYLWLDDEPERAQYYLSLYRDGMLRTVQANKKSHTQPYTDVLGW